MKERSYRALLWTLAVLGLLLDQGTKYGVFAWRYEQAILPGDSETPPYVPPFTVIPGVFELLTQFTPKYESADDWLGWLRTRSSHHMPRVNHGALFGLGSGYALHANTIFAVVSLVAAIAIIVWSFRRTTARDLPLCAALGLILGGTLGNLFDRLVFGGVRDFLHFYWFEFPVFNVADSCLVCGAALLLIQAFWSHSPAATADAAESRQAVA
jgi:lipoprotein signal peptidase